jgi:hypothetical protein
MSIGGRTPLTGPLCPGCKDGGLSDHTTFEGAFVTLSQISRTEFFFLSLGDASLTRGKSPIAYFLEQR